VWLWDAFVTLSQCRGHGFSGPEPIRFSEIKAYADELQIEDTELRARFFKRIRLMDTALLNYCDEQDETQKKGKKKT